MTEKSTSGYWLLKKAKLYKFIFFIYILYYEYHG